MVLATVLSGFYCKRTKELSDGFKNIHYNLYHHLIRLGGLTIIISSTAKPMRFTPSMKYMKPFFVTSRPRKILKEMVIYMNYTKIKYWKWQYPPIANRYTKHTLQGCHTLLGTWHLPKYNNCWGENWKKDKKGKQTNKKQTKKEEEKEKEKKNRIIIIIRRRR